MADACSNCGRSLGIGDTAFQIDGHDDLVFCTEKCASEYCKDNLVDDIVEDWLEDRLEEVTIEDEDPYARYGVSRSDF